MTGYRSNIIFTTKIQSIRTRPLLFNGTFSAQKFTVKNFSFFSRDDPWAMDRSKVIVEYQSKLGSGAFCNVHKGHIKGPAAIRRVFPDLIVLQKFTDCDVAVKLLPSFADDIARSDFNQVSLSWFSPRKLCFFLEN